MFSDNRPGKGNSNTCRSCTDSDSGYSSHGGVDLGTGSDVWYLRLPRFLVWKRSLFFNAFLSARCCAHAELAVVLCICGCLCIPDTVGRIDLVFGTDPSHNLSYAEIRVRANKLHFPLEFPPPRILDIENFATARWWSQRVVSSLQPVVRQRWTNTGDSTCGTVNVRPTILATLLDW